MPIDPSEAHSLFRESVIQFARREMEPIVAEFEEKEQFPVALMKKAGAAGFLGTAYDESVGGMGADRYYDAIFMEEASRCCAGITAGFFAHSYLGCYPIYKLGHAEQKRKYLAKAIRGEKIAAFALTEPSSGSDAAGLKCTAKRDGANWILNGQKTFITNGSLCDYMIVAAYTDPSKRGDGIALFIVDCPSPGLTSRPLRKMGNHTADTAEVFLDEVRVPAANLLGEVTGGFNWVKNNLIVGRMLYGARALGIARSAFEEALGYAKARHQFGQALGKFQMIKSKLARMAATIEAMRPMVYNVIADYEAGENIETRASMVKLFCAEQLQWIVWEALQIHGGYGYMKEYKIERIYRDARLLTIPEGTSEIHQLIIAKGLGL